MSQQILFEQKNDVGLITLNRPDKLNALSFEMCALIDKQLLQWQDDDSINAVIIRGNGDRAFCAGGDIKAIYHNGHEKIAESIEFFKTEYTMNARIFHFTKPYIALLHGITMGGGLGVSIHGSCRIADPDTVMAMPETGIGFFPDVGGSYFLSRGPGELGTYLGLTGARFSASDGHHCGLIDYQVDKENFDELTALLIDADLSHKTNVADIVERFAKPFGDSQLVANEKLINHYFLQHTVEDILDHLANDEQEFAADTLVTLQKKSPTSLRLTLQQLRDGKRLTFDECMAMEFRMVKEVLAQHDFYEGVRAAVIDKDNQPQWEASR